MGLWDFLIAPVVYRLCVSTTRRTDTVAGVLLLLLLLLLFSSLLFTVDLHYDGCATKRKV